MRDAVHPDPERGAAERRPPDVDGRASRDHRYETLFTESAEAIIVFDAAVRVEEANAAALALVDHTLAELRARKVDDLLAEDERSRTTSRLAELRDRGHLQAELSVRTKSGERVPVDVTARVLRDGRVLAVLRDLRPKREAERMRQQLAAQERLAALGGLAASVGHEINNPLTWIIGNLDAASSLVAELPDALRGELPAILADAREGAERVRRIVADLRLHARAPGEDDEVGQADIAAVVRSALHLAVPAVRERALLFADIPEGLPEVVGDERRLAQVVLNLVTNAADAVKPGTDVTDGMIRLALWREVDDVVLEVRDDGVGIPDDVLPRVFDPFFTTKPANKGTGVGLAVSREILHRSGASIAVMSEFGVGTCFTVRLKAAAPRAVESPSAESTSPPATDSASVAPFARRVLIVEDEPLVARALARALRDHDVVVATGPVDALARCAEREFDCIFCDLTMPEGGGQAFLEGLQARHPKAVDHLVFTTGGAITEAAARFLERAGRPILQKPIDLDALAALVRSAPV